MSQKKGKNERKKERETGWDPTLEEPIQSPGAWDGEAYLLLGLYHDPRSTVVGSNPHQPQTEEDQFVISISESERTNLLMVQMA